MTSQAYTSHVDAESIGCGLHGKRSAPDIRKALLRVGIAMLAVVAASPLILSSAPNLTTYFAATDRLWLAVGGVALMIAGAIPVQTAPARWAQTALRRRRLATVVIAVAVLGIAAAGAYLAYHGYALSRDETMADFDAAIFRAGHLVAPVAPEWRAFVPALSPIFRLPIAGDVAWVSLYLPGNAALRALFSFVADPRLLNPILAAVAVLAVAGVARRLWPSRPDAALVAAMLLATSAQMLVTAMTPYAMTAHLAFNLVWLWLFLRGGVLGHAAAIGVGVVATGLHQLVFHPLFVAPFVLQLFTSRRWALALVYTVAYALICACWVFYWQFVLAATGLAAAGTAGVGSQFILSRAADLLQNFNLGGFDLMAKNLIRFFAWQNPLVLPLAVLGAVGIRRIAAPLRPMILGIVLTLVAMFILLPYQGHGWGYRYLSGFLGSFCLLAAAGWISVTDGDRSQNTAAWSVFGVTGAFALLVVFPARTIEAEKFVAPYAAAFAAIERAPADIVFVDGRGFSFSQDLARNDPFLRNRPLVMDVARLNRDQLDDLCKRYRVAVVDRRQGIALGISEAKPEDARLPSPFQGTSCAPVPVSLTEGRAGS